jgi:anti-anti-sigma factor
VVSTPELPRHPTPEAMFGVAVSVAADQATMRVSGELDYTFTERLYPVLDGVRRDGHRYLVVGLAELEFLSASDAGVLTHAAHDYAHAGGSLALSQPNRVVTRALELTGLDHLITTAPNTPDAPARDPHHPGNR